jgi:hypothetical protein
VIGAFQRASAKSLQAATRGAWLLEPGLIAMQKVEGSNPFSRFPEIPLWSGISSFRFRKR